MGAAAPAKPLAAISWSAGKDSCLAWLRALDAGLDVRSFLTMCDASGLSKSHVLPPALIAAQVQAMGGAWVPALAGPGEYADVFNAALRALRDAGHTHMVFGDIDLPAHREICGDAAVYFPRFSHQLLADRVVQVGQSSALRTRLAECGLKRSREFSWRDHVDQVITLAQSLKPSNTECPWAA